ncbi:MAG: S49 family peptidase [Candidatus Latescibacterota bacterium]|jgi:protease-4
MKKKNMMYPSASLCSLLFLLLPVAQLWAQSAFPSYATRGRFLLGTPASSGNGLYGYANPALLNYVEQLENTVAFSSNPEGTEQGQWGLFSAAPHLGLAMLHSELGQQKKTDYQLSFSAGDRRLGLGFGYGFSSGDTHFFERKNHYALGVFWRPEPRLSLGTTFTSTFNAHQRELAVDLGLRPLASERLTLFADYARTRGRDAFWSAGGRFALLPGLDLTGRYFNNRTLSFDLNVSLGAAGIATQSRFDEDRHHAFSTYAIRLGGYRPSLGNSLTPKASRFLQLELNGPVRHRRFALFDNSRTLVDLLALIERARRDEKIGGIAINASGLRINREMAWELREKLRQLQSAGKRVVIYIDYATLSTYHFASVADHLVLDPAGMLVLEGYASGHTYLKGALDKLGIGVDEWSFFDYKSAWETFTRAEMSSADREQSQALVDDFYALARREIGLSRQINAEEFDRLVDEETLFLAHEALKKGLVDRLGRWSQIEDITRTLGARGLKVENYPRPASTSWGQLPRIAIVYALGVCALDSGIHARTLAIELKSVCEDARFDAVVLRVDSPGGEVLASDLVADEVRQCRAYKPIVVSQGYVAASGGYWLSMNADAIVAAPNTITGSIGVIGGWIYNAGLKEKIGLSTDHVQAGKHADLPFGMVLPLIGLPLPDRNLTEKERASAERAIRSLYGDFVAKVAANRDKRPFEAEELARGRVWSGQRALEHGLIDKLGGLDTALHLAAEMANISTERGLEIDEFPRLPLLNPALFQPQLIAAETGQLSSYLQFRLRHNGRPLLLTPDTYWQDQLFGNSTFSR